MGAKSKVTVGAKTYMVDVSTSKGKWTACVISFSDVPGYCPVWTCEAISEMELKKQLDVHFEELKVKSGNCAQGLSRKGSGIILMLLLACAHLAFGQTQQQINLVNVYAAYTPLEVGMEMVATEFPMLAERATAAKSRIQKSFAKTLAYVDKSMTAGSPNGVTKWPELKRNMRRQLIQVLSVPSDVQSANEVIRKVEQAAAGQFPPTLRSAIESLPSSEHPEKCSCGKCSGRIQSPANN